MNTSTAHLRGPALGSGRGGRRKNARLMRPSLAFALPLAAILLVFVGYPMFELVRMSVSDVRPATLLSDWPFVGLQNFTDLFISPDFIATVWRTVVFALIVLVVGVGGGLVAALALARPGRVHAFTYALLVLLWTLPPIVSGATWKFLLSADGFINVILLWAGIIDEPILFLIDGPLPLLSVALVAAWVCVPFATIAYRAALLDVPREYYEAAEVDGAGPWTRFWYVTLPHLRPTTYIVSILLLSYAVRSFDFAFVMTGGGPGTVSTTLPLMGYLTAFTAFDYSAGAAIAVVTVISLLFFALPYARSLGRNSPS